MKKKPPGRGELILDLSRDIAAACQDSGLGQREIRDAMHTAATLMEHCSWFRTRSVWYLNPGEVSGGLEESPESLVQTASVWRNSTARSKRKPQKKAA